MLQSSSLSNDPNVDDVWWDQQSFLILDSIPKWVHQKEKWIIKIEI